MKRSEALDIIRKNWPDGRHQLSEALETLIPELNEDDRMRTFLHETFTVQYLAKDKLGKWHGEPVVNILAWLEKQGSQNLANSAKSCKDEQNTAWSEEDEMMLEVVIGRIGDWGTGDLQKDWLKSLKARYTWKPSDAQMECLLCEVNAWTKGCIKRGILESLYNDLKKLKG